MTEASKIRSITVQHRWDEADNPSNPVERTKVLVDDLEVRDIITARDDYTRRNLRQRLDEVYEEHSKRGLVRTGATLLVGIAVFEKEASDFIVDLVKEVAPVTRSARVYALITEAVEQLLRLFDGELDCIARKVELEIQDTAKTTELVHGVKILWAEKRDGLLQQLERHSEKFAAPPVGTFASPLSTKVCMRCERWEPMAEGPESRAGFCHRFALAPQNDGWPITEASDCCDEWSGPRPR